MIVGKDCIIVTIEILYGPFIKTLTRNFNLKLMLDRLPYSAKSRLLRGFIKGKLHKLPFEFDSIALAIWFLLGVSFGNSASGSRNHDSNERLETMLNDSMICMVYWLPFFLCSLHMLGQRHNGNIALVQNCV